MSMHRDINLLVHAYNHARVLYVEIVRSAGSVHQMQSDRRGGSQYCGDNRRKGQDRNGSRLLCAALTGSTRRPITHLSVAGR